MNNNNHESLESSVYITAGDRLGNRSEIRISSTPVMYIVHTVYSLGKKHWLTSKFESDITA